MTIFVIIPKSAEVRRTLSPTLTTEFPDNNLLLESGEWLVSATGVTSADVATRLGVTLEGGPSIVVFTITGYFGRGPANVWEWLKAKMEAGVGV